MHDEMGVCTSYKALFKFTKSSFVFYQRCHSLTYSREMKTPFVVATKVCERILDHVPRRNIIDSFSSPPGL